jgi:hypothetical protein
MLQRNQGRLRNDNKGKVDVEKLKLPWMKWNLAKIPFTCKYVTLNNSLFNQMCDAFGFLYLCGYECVGVGPRGTQKS